MYMRMNESGGFPKEAAAELEGGLSPLQQNRRALLVLVAFHTATQTEESRPSHSKTKKQETGWLGHVRRSL